jgi:hypothetical protein
MALVQIPTPVAATGTNWTLLNTGDTSVGTSTIKSYSGLGGYDKYYVEMRGLSSTTSIQPGFTMALNGGTGSATAFVRTFEIDTSRNVRETSTSFGGTSTTINLGFTANGSGSMNAIFYMDGGSSAGIKHYYLNSMGDDVVNYGARGRYHEGQYSLAITSLSFAPTSGNFDAGSVFIYGA